MRAIFMGSDKQSVVNALENLACGQLEGCADQLPLELFTKIRILSTVSNGLLLNAVVIGGLVTVAALSLVGEFGIRSYRSSLRLPSYIIRTKLDRRSDSS